MDETSIVDTLSSDPADQGTPLYIDTKYLAEVYGSFFTEEKTSLRKLYIEKPIPDTQFRSCRYVASISETENPALPMQDLAKLYSKEGDIWTKQLVEEDLEKVIEAVSLIKVSTGSARVGDAPVNMARDIKLTDGSTINVERVPYTQENKGRILADMNQHLEVEE